MGTRNLTIVRYKGKYCVAQYGQWDGYPSGQGATVLRFLRRVDLGKFRERLQSVRFMTNDEITANLAKHGVDASAYVSLETMKLIKKTFPSLDRDVAADILEKIYGGDVAELQNEIEFICEPCCEWAYVIDLDANTFEVYRGGNKLTADDRFFEFQNKSSGGNDSSVSSVKMIKCYDIGVLPEVQDFIAYFDSLEQ